MIAPKCNRCDSELEEPGGLLFSAPDDFERVNKIHLCIKCLPEVVGVAIGLADVVWQEPAWKKS